MTAEFLVFFLSIGVVYFSLLVAATVFNLIFSKKDKISKKDVVLTSSLTGLGFGWLLGSILYFINIKKVLQNDKELSKVARNSFIVSLIVSFVMITLISGISVHLFRKGDLKSPNHQATEKSLPNIDVKKENNTTLNSNSAYQDVDFSAEFPCESSKILTQSQNIAGAETKLYICTDTSTSLVYMIAKTNLNSNLSPDMYNTILTQVPEGFARGSGATIINTQKGDKKISSNMTTSQGKVAYRAEIREAGGSDKLWQFIIMSPSKSFDEVNALRDDFADNKFNPKN